jgi:large subunit ribosomal protein LP1
MNKAEHDELCCVYAALLLFDDKVDITADKLNKVITASGNTVEGYYPEFFAKYLSSVDLNGIISSVGAGPAASAPVQAAAVVEAQDDKKGKGKEAPKKEEKKPEPEPEEEAGFGDLFG